MPDSPPQLTTPQLSQSARRRTIINSRACDRCRRRKAKCDSTGPGRACSLCREAGEICTFDLPLARRGPKTRKRTENGNGLSVLSDAASTSLSSYPGASTATNGTANGLGASGVVSAGATAGSGGGPVGGGPPTFGSPSTSPTTSWEAGPPRGHAHGTTTLGIDPTLSPQAVRSSISDPAATHVLSALQRWHSLSRTLGLMNVAIEHMVTRCFDLFFEYLYPLTPLVHEPSLRDGLVFFLSQAHAGLDAEAAAVGEAWPDFGHHATTNSVSRGLVEPWPDSTFTLITAVCAEAAFLLPKDLFAEGETVADVFLQASRNCLNHYLEADLESPNANSITIRYFHSNCLHAAGKPKYSWHIFGEATRLAQVMQLHEESSLEGLYPIEAELRRRAFWIVYMGDKSAAILNNRPITIHKFSFESGITTSYPTGIEDETEVGPSPMNGHASPEAGPPSFIEGFNANLRLWQAASDLLLEIRLLHDQEAIDLASSGIPRRQLSSENRRRIDALYVRFITCLDDLPPYLQSYTFAASIAGGGTQTTQSNQFVIQCANLQVSLHCLRMVITQKFEDLSYWGLGVEQADLRRTEIARDMLRVMHEAPFWSLQVNGEPYVEKIRLIGASLLAIIQGNQNSPLAARARADFSVLLDILTRLDSKASDALRNTTTWDVYPTKA